MKKITTIILALLAALGVQAATLSPAEQKEVTARLNAAAVKMTSMSCDFTQTKHLAMLKDNMVSRGKMYYKKPDKLRWEYATPYRYTFILNGTKVSVKNDRRKDVIDTKSNKVFKEVARIMMNTVTGKALSSPQDFAVSIADSTPAWIVTLVPKRKDMKQMFGKIILRFRKSDSMVTEINIFEKNGDTTDIKLSNIKTPATLNESLFTVS